MLADTGERLSGDKRLSYCTRSIIAAEKKLRAIIMSREIPERFGIAKPAAIDHYSITGKFDYGIDYVHLSNAV